MSNHEYIRDLEADRDNARRESDIQLGQKLAAQMTLKAVCDALDLPMVSLGNGWTEATPKILARIEAIVDEGERGFAERDRLREALESISRLHRWMTDGGVASAIARAALAGEDT